MGSVILAGATQGVLSPRTTRHTVGVEAPIGPEGSAMSMLAWPGHISAADAQGI